MLLLSIGMSVVAGARAGAEPRQSSGSSATSAATYDVLHPFWAETTIDREPLLFVKAEGNSLPTARLLLQPSAIVAVTSGDGSATYEAGRDYTVDLPTGVLTLTKESRIPSKEMAELFPSKGTPHSFGVTKTGSSSIFFAEGGAVFQGLQVNVTYKTKAKWNGYIPQSAQKELPLTFAKLRSQKPLKVVVLGDSISHGACASGTFHGPPFQPPYAVLVQQALAAKYHSDVSLINLAVGGKTSEWGADQARAVAKEDADLVILAFGMNDATFEVSPAEYRAHLRTIMEQVKAKNPSAEFILVATMTGNPDWAKADEHLYSAYRKDLLDMEGPGVAVADMTKMWRDLLKLKRFTDLTGNGINHPNDFGHRVYAAVILALLS